MDLLSLVWLIVIILVLQQAIKIIIKKEKKPKYDPTRIPIENTTETIQKAETDLYQTFREKRKNAIEKGKEYEKQVGIHYENLGYKVDYRGLKLGRKDGGIDLIAEKDDETILIQCKNWTGKIQIKKINAEKFHSNCITYLQNAKYEHENIKCVMVIPAKESLNYGAEIFFRLNSPKYRYEIIKYRD